MSQNPAHMHRNYTQNELVEDQVDPDPIKQFTRWFEDATQARSNTEPNGMALATATPEGRPSVRTVLLKGFDERGFVFYTNYNSRKGQELGQNPWAALMLWWDNLERQVRIEGRVEKLTPAESEAYFNSRPKGSRFGAMLSEQSQVIAGRHVLAQSLQALEIQYADSDPPRPQNWGGYRVKPVLIEFWQGRENRLHDRLRYRLEDGGDWILERLAP